MTNFISLLALVVAGLAAFINDQQLRLALYNKRFNIYTTTIQFYHVLLKSDNLTKDEAFEKLRSAFIICYRESQFLFDKKDGIFDLLDELNDASFKIIGKVTVRHVAEIETLRKTSKDAEDAISFWNNNIKKLEEKMSKYLHFHNASTLSQIFYSLRHLVGCCCRKYRRAEP